jgi:hypothetical protein
VTSLVFDTTALSHFARAGRTDTLRMVVADDEPILLAEVATELARGVSGYRRSGAQQQAAGSSRSNLRSYKRLRRSQGTRGNLAAARKETTAKRQCSPG